MARSEPYIQGRRAGLKYAITWLHKRANEMNDPTAKTVLNTAAFNLGVEARTDDLRPLVDEQVTKEKACGANGEPWERD